MMPDEALASVGGVHPPNKPTEADLEIAGLTTGVLVLLAALWSLLGHHLSSRSRYLNESGTACLLGLGAGLALLAWRDTTNAGLVNGLLRFNSAAFFTYLLPPVIFYAGLSVEQRLFFSNLPSILSFGVLGTLVSFVLMSAALYSLGGTTFGLDAQDCLALGAVFAATDSVAVLGLLDPRASPKLFSLVFGEGIVNDATSVVLLGALARMARQARQQQWQLAPQWSELEAEAGTGAGEGAGEGPVLVWRLLWNFGYLLMTSTWLGIAAGFGVAMVLRAKLASQGPHHEVAVVGLLSYLAYLSAEVLGLSAILSLFCCGATVSHFALRSGGGAAAATSAGGDDPSTRGSGHALTYGFSETSHVSTELSVGGAAAAGDAPSRDNHAGGVGAGTLTNGDVGVRLRYGVSGPTGSREDGGGAATAAAGGAGAGDDDGWGEHGMLWVLTAPAKRLAARAFGGGGASCMTPAGTIATLNAFHSLSYVSEGLIFVYLGMDCLDPERWKACYPGEVVWLVTVLLLFLLAARAASVVPLSMLHNLYAPRHQRLSGRDMLVIWWSGLMRGAVSVALVYLNFDTLDGSTPLAEAVVAPHRKAGGGGGGGDRHLHLRRRARGLLDGGILGNATAAAAAAADPDEVAAAAATVAALAEADEESSRQHATLIASTLLVVVASVLVVSTFTKPVLQAVMEADPRKPPLQVLSEALFDPWVDATWRLKVALDRSYRRWTYTAVRTTAEGDDGAAAAATTATATPSGARCGSTAAAVASFAATHTIPMTSLAAGGGGGDAGYGTGMFPIPRGMSAPAAANPGHRGSSSSLSLGLAAAGGPVASPNSEDFNHGARSRAGSAQQRAGGGGGGGGGAGAGAGGSPPPLAAVGAAAPSPSPGAAQLQGRGGREEAGCGGGGGPAGASPVGSHTSSSTISYDSRGHGGPGAVMERPRQRQTAAAGSSRWAADVPVSRPDDADTEAVRSEADAVGGGGGGGSGGERRRASGSH